MLSGIYYNGSDREKMVIAKNLQVQKFGLEIASAY
jgi:hypothetical protein